MITLDLVQGSDEWKATRLENYGASEAPSMMGESKYMSRNELLKMKFTGESKPVTSFMQKIFDKGHATEAMARPLVEEIVGEDLYPVTGLLEGSKILSSYDGLTMMEDVVYEHKLWNETLAENVKNKVLEPHYYWQLEQQLLVADAEKVIFVTSDGTELNFEYMWYESVPKRRKALIAGWEQFGKDLAEYQVEAKKEVIVAVEQESFPVIQCKVEGTMVISNLGDFIPTIKAAIDERLSVILETDQDFADTEAFVKNIKLTRVKLKQEQVNITNAFDSYSVFVNDVATTDGILQQAESKLNLSVKNHKASKKLSIVNNAYNEFNKHLFTLSETINGVQINQVVVDFDAVMKGKRSFDKMEESVNSALANAKIEASEIAQVIRKNLDSLTELAKDHRFLFSDHATLLLKDNDDLVNLIKARISEHEEEEKERIRLAKEKIEREAKETAEREAAEKLELEAEDIRKKERAKVLAEQKEISDKLAQEQLNKTVERKVIAERVEVVQEEKPVEPVKQKVTGGYKTKVIKTPHENMMDKVIFWATEYSVNNSALNDLKNILNQYK